MLHEGSEKAASFEIFVVRKSMYVKLGYHYLINYDIYLPTIPVLVANLQPSLYNSQLFFKKK